MTQGDADPGADGMTAFDLLSLPANLRPLLRLLLRRGRLSYEELCQAAAALPPPLSLSPAELDDALLRLVQQRWITSDSHGGSRMYRIVVRRKTARPGAIWDVLDSL